MSEPLRVFHGYRIPEGTSVMALAELLRTAFLPVRDAIEIREVALQASRILGEADLAGTARPASVIFDAVQAHAAHVGQIVRGEHSCPLPTASVAVSDDPETGQMYALLHAQHAEYGRAMDDHAIGDYFPYWDAAADLPEHPMGVSAAQWAERRDIWTRVLRGTDPANPDGMFQIALGRANPDTDLLSRTTEVLAVMPDLNERVIRAANVLASEQEFDSMAQQFAFAASMPGHMERFRTTFKPITLTDLAGGAS
ncbi:MAG TPA: hypothetical protein VF867_18730 [Arthrobacter sp.]